MTFKDVVLKNFKGNMNQYVAYFLSGSFSIMLFFLYSTLYFNKELGGREDTDVLTYVFPITLVAIALFSIFFINYAHSAFIRGRNKEFGIYTSLGVTSKELLKLINTENILINSASLVTGITVGALFSRLFLMVILNLLEIKNIHFSLNYLPFLITILVFTIIFATVMLGTFLRMRKTDISSLLKEARRSQGREYNKKDPIFGGLGLFIMACSVVFVAIIANDDKLNSNPLILMLYMTISFWGIYLSLSYGGNLIIHLIKNSRFYYQNMLSVTELHHKFNQNRKIIFVLSILSTMTIFLVASPFSLFSLSKSIAELDKNHLEYVETATINNLPEDALKKILQEQEITSNKTVKFIYLSSKAASDKLSDCKPVISADEYKAFTGIEVKLAQGEAVNIILEWIPGNYGIEKDSTHTFYAGNNSYRFQFQNSAKGEWIASIKSFPTQSAIVISNEDYAKLLKSITDQNIGYYHMIDFKKWEKSKETINALRKALGNSELKVGSIIDSYENLRSSYSVFLFVSTVMGILFFVAGGSVLYFKQFTELPETKATFHKLTKIGISYSEIKKIIGKELLSVFFLPLIFGAFSGLSLIYLMTYLVDGDAIIREFMTNALFVILIYFLSQGIFYYLARKKYMYEIVK